MLKEKNNAIAFKLYDTQLNNILISFRFYTQLMNLDWNEAFKTLGKYAYKEEYKNNVSDKLDELTEKLEDILYKKKYHEFKELESNEEQTVKKLNRDFTNIRKYEKENEQEYIFELDMSMTDIDMLLKVLDTYIRMALGQWENLGRVLDQIHEKDSDKYIHVEPMEMGNCIANYRNQIFNTFEMHGIWGDSASFGIHSLALSENVRSCYEVYKEIMYQVYCTGVYDTKPVKIANDDTPLPRCEVPYEYILTYDGDDKFAEAMLYEKKKQCYKELRSSKRYEDVPDKLFLPVKEERGTFYRMLTNGDRIYQKENGYYIIVPKKKKEPKPIDIVKD